MKIIYATDLHGNKQLYERLLVSAESTHADCIIIGGELSPCDCEFEESIVAQREFIETYLGPLLSQFKDRHPNKELYLMMGNYEWSINMDALEKIEEKGVIKLLHGRLHPLKDGFYLTGYGFVPPTPFNLKDWERLDSEMQAMPKIPSYSFISTKDGMKQIKLEEWLKGRRTIREDLTNLTKRSNPKRTIYVMHSPPYGTNLDRLYDGSSVGSKSIRDFIDEHQPYLTLHGHIHESPMITGKYMEEIGMTLSINPGQTEYDLQAVVFELSDVKATVKLICA
jgi:Predicted phosphoesterases, related to the Icc protein